MRDRNEGKETRAEYVNAFGRFLSFAFPYNDVLQGGPLGRFASGPSRTAHGPSNSELIAPGSMRQRQKFAKANIVIGSGTGEERRRTGTKEGTRRETERIAKESKKRRPWIRDHRSCTRARAHARFVQETDPAPIRLSPPSSG